MALANPPTLAGHANVVGKKEGEGPLASSFDLIGSDDTFGEATWEKSESAMQKQALALALDKAGQAASTMDWLFAGDLLNQCIGSSFAARGQDIPFFGLYGACSTMGEGLALASMTLDGGFGEWAAVVVSSHFCTAERQYRMPVPYGSQRPPTAQWTATASGCTILAREGEGPYITHITCGKIVDKGVTDANNMGAAMAPAAYDSLAAFFRDTGTGPRDYDLVITGDLGELGHAIVRDFFARTASTWGRISRTVDCCSMTGTTGYARRSLRLRLLCVGAQRVPPNRMRRGNGRISSSLPPERCSHPRPVSREESVPGYLPRGANLNEEVRKV